MLLAGFLTIFAPAQASPAKPSIAPMDLTTFETLQEQLKTQLASRGGFTVKEYEEPRSLQVVVRQEARPSVHHHVVIFPSGVEGLVVRKTWVHDHDVGIETPTQSHASPEMVLQHLQELLTPEINQKV